MIGSSSSQVTHDRQKLFELIRKKSYREGEFTLSSGLKSSFYLDLKPTLLDPLGASMVGRLVASWIEEAQLEFDGIGGLTLGADPIVMSVSLMLHLEYQKSIPATMIRKEPKKHGTSRYIEGVENFKPNSKFLVVEDVMTTGASAIQAIEKLRAEHYQPTHVLTVVDRENGGREKIEALGLEVKSLFRVSEFFTN